MWRLWLPLGKALAGGSTIATRGAPVSGASLRVDSPAAAESEVPLASLPVWVLSANLRRMALRCLIVDDSEEFLGAARGLLVAQGLEIVGLASSGADALRLAETLQPDVVLVDVQLGDEDGLAIAERLDARAPATRIVLISTHSEDDLAELIADSPAAGFLSKTALSAAAIARLVG